MIRFVVAFVSLALFASLPTFASDGVIEINQASAIAGGVTPGDTAGFPVTLSQPGSYRLTGNLTVLANTTAIDITARNVTLDLGGFEVGGPNVCSGVPVTNCTTAAGNPGIVSGSQGLVVVRNGRVYGMGGRCIALQGDSSAVHHVSTFHCGNDGIFVRGHSRVTKSTSVVNFGNGIRMENGGSAEWNEVRGNGEFGIFKFPIGIGIDLFDGIFIGNRAFNNGASGITGQGLMTKNVVRANGSVELSEGRSLGDNLCDGFLC